MHRLIGLHTYICMGLSAHISFNLPFCNKISSYFGQAISLNRHVPNPYVIKNVHRNGIYFSFLIYLISGLNFVGKRKSIFLMI